ncbi:MAG: DUF4292 domain-containing protein [Smithella sp.]
MLVLKNHVPFVAIFLLLSPLFSCDFNKQVIVSPEFSVGKVSASSFGFVDNDNIFSAMAHIDLMKTDGYYPVKAAIIIKRPSYLRLELLPLIGTPDFFLAFTPDKVNIFIPSRREFYSGQPTSSRLKNFLPWPIAIEDMLMIFTGTYPSFKEEDISYQGYRENNLLRLEMLAPSGSSQIIWVGENNKLLKLVRQDKNGQEVYTVKYIYDDDRGAVPAKITITMADGVTALTVRYADVSIEKATDLSVFDLAVPAGVKIMTLE